MNTEYLMTEFYQLMKKKTCPHIFGVIDCIRCPERDCDFRDQIVDAVESCPPKSVIWAEQHATFVCDKMLEIVSLANCAMCHYRNGCEKYKEYVVKYVELKQFLGVS